MQLQDFQVFQLRIPFKIRFSHSLATRAESESVLFAVADMDGHFGYGEGAPRGYVTGESMAETLSVLHGAAEFLQNVTIDHIQEVARLLEACPGLDRFPSARCAVELALLDLMGKHLRQPVLNLLGEAQTEQIFYSAVIPGETPEKVAQIAQQVAAMRVRQIKLKVGNDTGQNNQNLLVLREILGDNVEIRADANAAWTEDEAVVQIGHLLDAGVSLIEQPLAAEGPRERWLALKARLSSEARVYVDESVCSHDDAQWLVRHRAVDGFNLKVSKHGGILATLEIHSMAKEHGLFCQLGCHVGETSLLSAAGRIVAALTGDMLACEGSYGLLLMEKDLTAKPLQVGFQGIGPVAEVLRPGLGVDVNLSLLGDSLKV